MSSEAEPGHALWSWMRAFAARRLDRRSPYGLRLTINLVLFAAGVWAFAALLEDVLERDALVRWDLSVNRWFHAHATAAGLRFFSLVSLFGLEIVRVVFVLVALWLWHRRERVLMWAWLVTTVGGWIVDVVIKTTVHRSRPQYAAAFLRGHSYSFPSGHTMGATVAYTLMAFVTATTLKVTRGGRLALYVASSVIVLAVGFSRVYLGVHYPSDVLAGLSIGLAWMVASLTAVGILRDGAQRAR